MNAMNAMNDQQPAASPLDQTPSGAAPSFAPSMRGAPFVSELRLMRAAQPLTERWRQAPVAPRRATLLGVSFRPLQVAALGLDATATLRALLAYPFHLIRLGAYWNQIETAPGQLNFDALDWQVDAAEQAGKRIILNVGALKTFGYPEFFAPQRHLQPPLREGMLVGPDTHSSLLAAAIAFVTAVVERYRARPSVVAWQVEHEAVDPLGMEHSWRLSAGFAQAEVAAVRAADPARPIMMNGFLPTSAPVRVQQWWRTRDQGDSLAVAQQLADIVGVDYYPRHALASFGARTLYLDGSHSATQRRRLQQVCAWAAAPGAAKSGRRPRQVMISEGQAEPWESVTTPPNPVAWGMSSCLPEHVIENYTQCLRWATQEDFSLYAYLFWGAEYWVVRQQSGDPRYLRAFERILAEA
jgi:hypothetical protein